MKYFQWFCSADRQGRPVGVQAVQAQAHQQLGEVLLEPRRQAGERLEFAVLLGGVGVGVLDELAADGDGQSVGRDQLGLQDVVVVLGLAVDGLGQAVLAVPLAEVELPGAVQDHQEVAEQPSVVQGLHADQPADHVPAQVVQGRWRHVPQEVVQRVAVGDRLLAAAAEAVEVLQRLGAVQFESHLPSRAELQQEQHTNPARIYLAMCLESMYTSSHGTGRSQSWNGGAAGEAAHGRAGRA